MAASCVPCLDFGLRHHLYLNAGKRQYTTKSEWKRPQIATVDNSNNGSSESGSQNGEIGHGDGHNNREEGDKQEDEVKGDGEGQRDEVKKEPLVLLLEWFDTLGIKSYVEELMTEQ